MCFNCKYRDGKPYLHRKPTHAEDFRRSYLNPPSQQLAIKATNEIAMKEPGMLPNERLANAKNFAVDPNELFKRLNTLKRNRDLDQEKFNRSLTDKLTSLDDDQTILDQHVSRVFSPYLSPGTISPGHLQKYQNRHNEMSSSMPDFGKSNTKQTNEFILIELTFYFFLKIL